MTRDLHTPLRLVVIGGGISGLAAARAAVEAAADGPLEGRLEVVVLEREPRVGGKARTLERDGFRIEGGPTGFLDDEPTLDRLVAAAGLEKLRADEAAARRFLYQGGRLRELHAHPLRFARSGLLSPLGLARLVREAWVPPRRDDADESVHAFAERRLGRQAADRLIAPMVLGVFAGDARELSLPAAFPRMRALEREHGSLLRALRARRRAGVAGGGPAGPGAHLTSFAEGLQALPLRLSERGGFEVRPGVTVEALRPTAGGARWELHLAGASEPLPADGVVVATEPWAAAALLPEELAPARAALAAVPCPPVAVVALGYGPDALRRVPRGFGVLVPRGEGLSVLGVLWDSFLFPGRSPDGTLLVRAMLGGAVDREVGALEDEELERRARADVERLLGLREPPRLREVVRWPRAIPQYTLGHRERVEAVEAATAAWHARAGAPLGLAGNALDGVAFGKAAARGWREGTRVAAALAGTPLA